MSTPAVSTWLSCTTDEASTSTFHVPAAGFWTNTHSSELTVSSLPPGVDHTPSSRLWLPQ